MISVVAVLCIVGRVVVGQQDFYKAVADGFEKNGASKADVQNFRAMHASGASMDAIRTDTTHGSSNVAPSKSLRATSYPNGFIQTTTYSGSTCGSSGEMFTEILDWGNCYAVSSTSSNIWMFTSDCLTYQISTYANGDCSGNATLSTDK